jgi:hypothetical protein
VGCACVDGMRKGQSNGGVVLARPVPVVGDGEGMACLGGWLVGAGSVKCEKQVGVGLVWTDAEGGEGMGLEWLDMGMEAFAEWLANHEQEVVGYTGRIFDSPLARWLSDRAGRLYGIDEGRYGWALVDDCYWRPLPRWAQLFSHWLEASPVPEQVTGRQAFSHLAMVELALSRPGRLMVRQER